MSQYNCGNERLPPPGGNITQLQQDNHFWNRFDLLQEVQLLLNENVPVKIVL